MRVFFLMWFAGNSILSDSHGHRAITVGPECSSFAQQEAVGGAFSEAQVREGAFLIDTLAFLGKCERGIIT